MKTSRRYFSSIRGSALMTVIMVMLIMALLTASMLSYSGSERRSNEFNRLVLRTRNMAENTVMYATAQISSKLYRLRSTSPVQYVVGASGPTELFLPPSDSILATDHGTGEIDVHAGLFASSPLQYIDPAVAANASNPNKGLSAIVTKVSVVGSAKLTRRSVLPYTSYIQQDLSIAQIPLYQYAIFYNTDLEFGPGGDMIIAGPVHANGRLIARNQYDRTNTLQFRDRVTATGGFYANVTKLGAIYSNTGAADNNNGGTGPLYFQSPSGTVTNIRVSSTNFFNDHTMSVDGNGTETATTRNNFRDWATARFAGNLRTSAHEVTRVVLPGVDELANSIRKNAARAAVEPPLPSDNAEIIRTKFSRRAGLYIIVNPTGTNPDRADGRRLGIKPDGSTVEMLPYTYRCWLNSVGADGVSHTLTEVVLPGQPSYWDPVANAMISNNLPNRFTNVTAIGSNQVLRIPSVNAGTYATRQLDTPYQNFPDGAGPALPNFAGNPAAPVPTGYAIAAAPTMTLFPDGYFYDLRRARNSNGYPASRSAATPFDPRPIAKIDFDMTRLRLAVERTMYDWITSTAIYNPDVPTAANWNRNILNNAATPTTYSLYPNTGTVAAPSYTRWPRDALNNISSDPFKIYKATAAGVPPEPLVGTDLLNTTQTATPWYDGIAIYIHSVDAEDRTMDAAGTSRRRRDSGVRLWNGRGPVVSLTPTGRTGCSIATNDALYIVGHYNTNGAVNATATSTGYNGYSARYPDSSAEKLCNVMADAITILSQPVYVLDSGFYVQSSGWSDSLSSHTFSASSWSATWQTSNPGSSNYYDGIAPSTSAATRYYADVMPNRGTCTVRPNTSTDARQIKFPAATTEVSSCLLVGIVATRSAEFPRETELVTNLPLLYQPSGYQNSGGVHNFPRMLENWTSGNAGLYIRGSMVAMFQSEVACEPWLGTRIYSAPDRYWGLHENLRAENATTGLHDVPLEPMLINVSRARYTELDASQYADMVASIAALPTN